MFFKTIKKCTLFVLFAMMVSLFVTSCGSKEEEEVVREFETKPLSEVYEGDFFSFNYPENWRVIEDTTFSEESENITMQVVNADSTELFEIIYNLSGNVSTVVWEETLKPNLKQTLAAEFSEVALIEVDKCDVIRCQGVVGEGSETIRYSLFSPDDNAIHNLAYIGLEGDFNEVVGNSIIQSFKIVFRDEQPKDNEES